MKKLLSLVLALALIISILPCAFAGNTTEELEYDLTEKNEKWAIGVANDSAKFIPELRWAFFLEQDGDLNADGEASVPVFGTEGAFVRAASIELKGLKSGIYNVVFEGIKKPSGAIIEFHLVAKTEENQTYMTKENIAEFAKTLKSETRIGQMDLCAETSARFTSFEVEMDGDYYIIMIPIGANKDFAAEYIEESNRYYAYNVISKIIFSPVTYAREYVYNLNSQAFKLNGQTYSSATNSKNAGVLKYAGENKSSNKTRDKEGGWVASKSSDTANAVIRNWNSLAYHYINSDNNKWAVVDVPEFVKPDETTIRGVNNIYATNSLLYTNFDKAREPFGTYITLKIDVPVAGKYNISITPEIYGEGKVSDVSAEKWVGVVADIYVVSPSGYSAESWLSTDKVTTVRYFKSDVAMGTFEVAAPGDYYVVFDYNTTDAQLKELVGEQNIDVYVAQTKSITLTRTGNTDAENAKAVAKAEQQGVTGNPATESGETEPTAAPTVSFLKAYIGGDEKNTTLTNESTETGGIYTVTADAAPAGYSFLYWTKGLQDHESKRIVSVNEQISFKPEIGSNYLIAVYGKNGDKTQSEKYFNANGQLLPDNSTPSMPGYGAFKGWADCGNNIFMAEYEGAESYSITVKNDGVQKETLPRGYGEEVKVTAPARAADGYRVFAYWEKNGEIVSFDKTYVFYAFEDCTVNAVYKEYAPLVTTLRKIILTNIGGSNYMAEFIGFGDAIEKGIKVGDNKIAMTTNKTQFTIDAEKETDVKGYAVDSEGDVYYSK